MLDVEDDIGIAGDDATQRSKRFAEGAHNQVHFVDEVKVSGRAVRSSEHAQAAYDDEQRIIEYFNENPDIDRWDGEIYLNGKPHLAHFSARRMEEGCLRCHGDPKHARRYGRFWVQPERK